ncbi:MAG: carbon monoxide dehydrogenase subunit G [Burkholderiaceae bacterium]|jgi:carbon monoxide dehydrogenase subunit G
MQLASEQLLPVSQEDAWKALNDIQILKESIPGCESITPTGDNEYELALTAAIGPVKAKFKGKMRLTDIQAPTSYTIQFEGQGGAAGHGKGAAEVRLEAVSATQTKLSYSANAQVGGKIAQVGSRLVDMAAQKMATEFFQSFNNHLQARYAPAGEVATAAAPEPSMEGAPKASPLERFLSWLKGLFR